MKTNYIGLWAQERQGWYAGPVIKKADIPKYTRIIMRYNKYYDKEKNRPKFVMTFADAEGFEEACTELVYAESAQEKIDKLAEVMRKGNANADSLAPPAESKAKTQELFSQAIELIEELTGEKWEFTFWNW